MLLTSSAFANTIADAQDYLATHDVKTYDCPDADAIDGLNTYLQLEGLPIELHQRLLVEKSHWMICMGQYSEAKRQLEGLLSSDYLSQGSEAHVNALYQMGFILDVLEQPGRCDYYAQAEAGAKDRFSDVYLSAQLGQITVCDSYGSAEGIKLGRLYALLELYANQGDKAAIAHIHNNIGLLYGALGQHVLAAEQFEKSYQIGLDVYESSNLLATLISVITSQMAAGDFDGARASIEEFKRQNVSVNTPLTNVWLHFAEAGYYYRTGNYDELRNSLAKWQVYLPQVKNQLMAGYYRWYNAALCLNEKNIPCLEDFLQQEREAPESYRSQVSKNKDYLRMQVDIQLLLGNVEAARAQFDVFADTMLNKTMDQQASGKVLGVANLHNQILALENNLAQARNEQWWSNAMVMFGFVVLMALLMYLLRRQYVARISLDPFTGLHNRRSVTNAIKRVPAPSKDKTNALALFDLDNFIRSHHAIAQWREDHVLRQIANTLQQVTRDRDLVGRLAPRQFILCLTNLEETTAVAFFERMREALEHSIMNMETGETVSLKSSMSIYVSTEGFDDLDDILADMQSALDKNSAQTAQAMQS
ncbi:GGDEF domain-containing protein [Aestuariibacter halophilus]|uniref:diguanylate cyclase n=1 Tax=Fluctibacter halophilus TaxID=226011 RepID=A0ABS8G4U7_9ALTE|nr:GGDEF domain-containing protein [Aestuariibacter halophilus]MCC2615468.1 GGDEF domain-containing protein [Aestuariibacter halophilus]